MRLAQLRYKLWHIMLAIAILGGLLALAKMTGFVAMPITICLVLGPSLMAAPGRRLRTATWICAIYPVLILASLYATWLTAWCVVGQPPQQSGIGPKSISPVVDVPLAATYWLIGGVPFVLLLFAPLAMTAADVARNPSARENQALKEFLQRVTAPISWGVFSWAPIPWGVFFWLSVFVILLFDPLGVSVWFID
jgi:hypothetical protein